MFATLATLFPLPRTGLYAQVSSLPSSTSIPSTLPTLYPYRITSGNTLSARRAVVCGCFAFRQHKAAPN